jgi:predicted transposase YbfD/YdcC
MVVGTEDIEKIAKFLGSIHDKRRHSGYFRHELIDVLVIGLCAVINGKSGFGDMRELGLAREEWFKTFLKLPYGIPGKLTFSRIFRKVNPQELMKCMYEWLDLVSKCGGRNINIDGKAMRGSVDGEKLAIDEVSVWVGAEDLVLAQIATAEKSNEITAIPKLLDMVDIKGDTVTIDAMGCQKDIAKKIVGKEADYILMVKENHPTMFQEIEDYFKWVDTYEKKDECCTEWESECEKGHGRIERRKITIASADWYEEKELWENLKTIVRCHSTRTTF